MAYTKALRAAAGRCLGSACLPACGRLPLSAAPPARPPARPHLCGSVKLTLSLRSTTVMSVQPRCDSISAADSPAGPPPTITTPRFSCAAGGGGGGA
jgi:hypothetical protein